MTRFTINRRRLLLTGLAGGAMSATGARAAFAQALRADGRKLVLIILRGAMDGLAALAPVAEPRYAELRGALAISGGTPIPGGFRLHPRFEALSSMWSRGEALAVHAAASAYRERSHFDGQDMLETGGTEIGLLRDGWLNRALQVMGAGAPGAVGIGPALPLVLRGDAETATWSPPVLPEVDAGTITRLMDLYADDAVLGEALQTAIETDLIAGGDGDEGGARMGPADLAEAAANLMTAPGGPDLAVIELEGWDTHVNQGAEEGALANRFSDLDAALAALKDGLAERWGETAVLVATEFGRTVRVNGGFGTDHGTGGVAFLAGGAVRGGDVVGDWPGLNALYEDRDLAPANDLRALFKAVLRDHWGIERHALDQIVFPGSSGVRAFDGLIV